jgi:hypothetical protein
MAEREITERVLLTAEKLFSTEVVKHPVSMDAFTSHDTKFQIDEQLNRQQNKQMQGVFTFSVNAKLANLYLTEKSNVYQFEKRTRPSAFTEQRKTLPPMIVKFVQFNNKIIPENRQLQLTEHPHWDFIIGVGNIWQEAGDDNFSRIAMPFALVEKNQNCVHNGVLSFLMEPQGKTSNFYYQISSETCLYYKADLWGKGEVTYLANSREKDQAERQSIQKNNADAIIEKYNNEINTRLKSQPVEALKEQNASIQLSKLALAGAIKPTDMTSFGVIFNGKHYTSQCKTRFGDYPFCQQLVLPSYSTAKSIFGGISMLHLARNYPSIYEEKISDWVDECQDDNWQGVTFKHLLNMTTGNYHSIGHSADEAAEHSQEFFNAKTHQEKVAYSCYQFSRKSTPGSTFVYHTSDTYLLGTAINAFIKHQLALSSNQQKVDVFDFIFKQQLWPEINLSSIAYSSRKTTGKQQQTFTGYGLFFIADDIAKLSQFLIDEQTNNSIFLDQKNLKDILLKNQSDKDIHSQYPFIHYSNGFWKRNVTKLLQCKKETWLPYMLGYGGISIVLANNNLQYYYFSDSGHYFWLDAIKELDKLTPLCRQ